MSSSSLPPQPPVPFSEFEFTFDPALLGLFPAPSLPLPSSADLFSPSETTDLLSFLDDFNWEFDCDPLANEHPNQEHVYPPSPITTSPLVSPVSPLPSFNSIASLQASTRDLNTKARLRSTDQLSISRSHFIQPSLVAESNTNSASSQVTSRVKPPLSTPQKRLNHIMSEQKRRNAIRDGYAQLISLLAPAGAPVLDMPTRGRPKGSGGRGKGRSKGKSGVLFRAVEYCRWLEEGRDALRDEVLRLEAAANIYHQ